MGETVMFQIKQQTVSMKHRLKHPVNIRVTFLSRSERQNRHYIFTGIIFAIFKSETKKIIRRGFAKTAFYTV